MTHSIVTYNAHLSYIKDWGKFLATIRTLRPATILAYIDNMNAKNRVYELQKFTAEFGTKIFVRIKDVGRGKIFEDDGGYHLQGGDRGYQVSPRTFVDLYGEFGKNGLTLVALNEPDGYSNYTQLNKWVLEAADIGDTEDVSMCFIGYATGHPAESSDMWVGALDPVLRRLSGSKRHTLQLHEYLPGDGWRIGRLLQMVRRCQALGILPPRTLITEWGVDVDHGGSVYNGYKSRGWSGSFYINTLLARYDTYYKALVEQGLLLGLCIFCYGDSGGWSAFDTEGDIGVHETIYEYGPRVDLDTTPQPTYPTLPAANDTRWKPALADTGVAPEGKSINVRMQPAELSAILTKLSGVSIVRVAPDAVYGEWWPVQVGNTYGWVYKSLLIWSFLTTTVPTKPYIPDYKERLDAKQLKLLELSRHYVKELGAFGAPNHAHMVVEDALVKYIESL